jgi:3-deoxy-manno-octulosonate cytidylyltransferase (CMP-KDO synthetase)
MRTITLSLIVPTALWHGEAIKVKVVDKTPAAGVDTVEDLVRVEGLMRV